MVEPALAERHLAPSDNRSNAAILRAVGARAFPASPGRRAAGAAARPASRIHCAPSRSGASAIAAAPKPNRVALPRAVRCASRSSRGSQRKRAPRSPSAVATLRMFAVDVIDGCGKGQVERPDAQPAGNQGGRTTAAAHGQQQVGRGLQHAPRSCRDCRESAAPRATAEILRGSRARWLTLTISPRPGQQQQIFVGAQVERRDTQRALAAEKRGGRRHRCSSLRCDSRPRPDNGRRRRWRRARANLRSSGAGPIGDARARQPIGVETDDAATGKSVEIGVRCARRCRRSTRRS